MGANDLAGRGKHLRSLKEGVEMARNITFVMQPETEFASLGALAKSLEDIRKLIRLVDYAATRRREGRLWRVEEIRSTAPTITLTPPPGEADAIDILARGLHSVAEEDADNPPGHFSEDALGQLVKMRRLFRGRERLSRVPVFVEGDDSEQMQIATIRRDTPKKVERILGGGYTELAILEGTLEVINLHGSPSFTIWEKVSGVPVRCNFPNTQDWKHRVRDLLEVPVQIEGQVKYFGNGIPRSVSRIAGLVDAIPDSYLPQVGFGSLPDITGTYGTIEYIREIRGG